MPGLAGISVPKFASFKPKSSIDEVDTLLRVTTTKPEGSQQKSRHSSSHHNTEHHERSRQSTRYEQTKSYVTRPSSRDSRPSERPSKRRKSSEEEVGHGSHDHQHSTFFIDTKGDPQNLVYGRLHRYQVPPFRRIGAGCVLGVPRHLRIDKQSAIDDQGLFLCSRKDELICRKYVFSKVERKGTRLLRIIPDDSSTIEDEESRRNADFIPLSKSRRIVNNALDSGSEDDKQHYRSIDGKAKGTKDEDVEFVTDSESDDSSRRHMTYDQMLREKSISLTKAVETHPTNIKAWQDLIDHQDSLVGLMDDGRRKMTSAEKQSVASIKIHLYEKALQQSPSNLENRESLLIGLMEEGSKIWDFKTQADRWGKISTENLESLVLWKKFIDFHQTSFQTFHYEHVRDLYLTRIAQLKASIVLEDISSLQTTAKRSILASHLIYTLLRCTLFIREAGFTELAIGIWQGVLEYNFCRLSTGTERSLSLFQAYWEAETLRLGESDSSGWHTYLERKSSIDSPEPHIDQEPSTLKATHEHNMFAQWADAERSIATSSRMPARTMDDVLENDPYRVILWSDISPYMIDLYSDTTELRALLIDAFLMFSSHPPLPSESPRESTNWWIDPFIRQVDLSCLKDRSRNEPGQNSEDVTALEVMESRASLFLLTCLVPSADTLFPAKGMPQYIPSLPHPDSHKDWPVPYEFISKILRYLTTIDAASNIAEYYLAFHHTHEPQGIKKIAKKLLKENPSSVDLYNAYALIEASAGSTSTALNVIKAALSIPITNEQTQLQHSISLWITWTWICLEENDHDTALKCILSVPNGIHSFSTIDTTSPTTRLQATQYFSTTAFHLQSIGFHNLAAQHLECLALLPYLTSPMAPFDLSNYLSTLPTLADTISSQTTTPTLLNQAAARLINYHLTKKLTPIPPIRITTFLHSALRLDPSNTILLSTLSFVLSTIPYHPLHDPIRSHLQSHLETSSMTSKSKFYPASLSTLTISRAITHNNNLEFLLQIHCISHALLHTTNITSTFETALSNPICTTSTSVWKSYIQLLMRSYKLHAKEVRNQHGNRDGNKPEDKHTNKELKKHKDKIKILVQKAITSCPWNKDLILFGVSVLTYGPELNLQAELVNAHKEEVKAGEEEVEAAKDLVRVCSEKGLRVFVDLEDLTNSEKDGL